MSPFYISCIVYVALWLYTSTHLMLSVVWTTWTKFFLFYSMKCKYTIMSLKQIRYQRGWLYPDNSWGQHRAHLGPVGPRWVPCWPHEPCYQGYNQTWFHTICPYLQASFRAVFCHNAHVSWVHTGTDEWVQVVVAEVPYLKTDITDMSTTNIPYWQVNARKT